MKMGNFDVGSRCCSVVGALRVQERRQSVAQSQHAICRGPPPAFDLTAQTTIIIIFRTRPDSHELRILTRQHSILFQNCL